jgi:arylsulfatase A-like enzyme
MLRILLALIALALVPAALRADDRPNILWIVAEDISPFFGCYGNPDATTPFIDAYAARSHVFLEAFATAPICAPSRSALATGVYATALGTQNLRSEVPIPAEIQPLATVFREHGYWTALRGKTDYNFEARGLFDLHSETTEPWAQRPKDRPFFAFMNLGATHEGSGNIAERAAPALARLPADRVCDPATVALPPYFPDTPEMRRIWARYHDLISVWDLDVQAVLGKLEAAGLADDTIVFLLADHGLGLPRYKRWLYKTGLHVPLIVHVPEKFRHLAPGGNASGRHAQPVSLIDLPATALALAGIEAPASYVSRPLFGHASEEVRQRAHIFGARDRADDMYDLSRSVYDGRYLYIRHYLPHQPPIQGGIIFGPHVKESLRELHRVHAAGGDTPESKALWTRRPHEELYDLHTDPQELHNLADQAALAGVKERLAASLRAWLIETRDTAFLPEPEMHRRATAAGLTSYEMARDPAVYPLENVLAAAEDASRGKPAPAEAFRHADPAVRFWALMGLIVTQDRSQAAGARYAHALGDENPVVRTTAAEGLARLGRTEIALTAYRELLQETEPNLGLFVARSLADSVDDVRPIEAEIRRKRESFLAPPGSPRPWKDFTYAAFTTWALEWALIKSGLNDYEDFAP